MANKFTTIKERVLQIAENKGISKESFFENLSITYGNFKGSAKKTPLNSDAIANILTKYPDINPNWLLTGDGDMITTNSLTQMNTLVQNVPLYNYSASAGKVQLFKDFTLNQAEGYISVPNMPKCDGAVPIVGDSMYPLLKSGDIVCYKIKEPGNIIYGEMYLVDWCDSDGDDFLMAKFIAKGTTKGFITLVSHNKHHDDLEIPINAIRQLALIKLSVRFNTH